MTPKDVLIARVYWPDDQQQTAPRAPADDVWTVSTAVKRAQAVHPFQAAVDVALEWAAERQGRIYRLAAVDGEPELYEPSA